MWIEELTNGKSKYFERYKDPMTLKLKRVSVTLDKNDRKTRKLAEEILEEKINAVLERSDVSFLTFSNLIDKYLIHQQKNVRESTYIRDAGECDIIRDAIGPDVLVEKLSARYIREALDNTNKKNITKNTYLKRIKAILRWGYRNDYVENISYLEKLTPYEDKRKQEKIEDKYLEQDEMNKLLSDIKTSRCELWVLLTRFLILSGLRIGEAIALTKKDIDGDVIHINKTYGLKTHKIGPPKKSESYRDVFIQNELKELITEIRNYNKRNKLTSTLLFSEEGTYIDYNNYRMFLRRHAKKSIGRVVTPHALRHTHASLLLAKGIGLEAIARRLGHKDSQVTRDVYIHILEELKKRDNEAIKNLNIM